MKANITFTLFSQPPERGNDSSHEGKNANKVKGTAKAKANPNIPTAGASKEPVAATSTSKVPIIGPVQEKETNTKVKAINKILSKPTVDSDLASTFVDHDEGKVSSKAPKNDKAKTTSKTKKNKLKMALVDMLFNALAPKISVINNPNAT